MAALLRRIKHISHQIEETTYVYDAIDDLQRQFLLYRQVPGEDNGVHLEKMKNLIDVLDHAGVTMFEDSCLIDYERREDKRSQLPILTDEQYRIRVREKKLAMYVLKRANMQIYRPLIHHLRNQYLIGVNAYPNTMEKAHRLLQNHSIGKKASSGQQPTSTGSTVTGMQCAQRGNPDEVNKMGPPVAGRDGNIVANKQCFAYGFFGHYANNFPSVPIEGSVAQQHDMHAATLDIEDATDSDEESVVIGFQGATVSSRRHQDTVSILLDTGSNCSVFNNRNYLHHIRPSRKKLRAYTNGGHQDSTHVGTLPGFLSVWYNPDSMLNILSFSEVSARYRITLDTASSDDICVHLEDSVVLRFKRVDSGLYMLHHSNNNNIDVTHYSMLNLVSTNKSNYTPREITQADAARELYQCITMPGYGKFHRLLDQHYFRNCPVTSTDAKRAVHIYGEDLAALKGKTTRRSPSPITHQPLPEIPEAIKTLHCDVMLNVDYMIVQNIAMLVSISSKYQFRTVDPLYKRKANKHDIITSIHKLINLYHSRGLRVTQINADNEFECIRDDIRPIHLNIVGVDAHVGEIERAVRTTKDDTRSHIHRLPFTHYPRAMVAGAVTYSIKLRNELPADNGVSTHLSPATLITGRPAPDYHDLTKLTFGTYVQTTIGPTTNTNKSRTMGAIALFPSGNTSGSWYFMSTLTGDVIHRYWWKTLPATEDVIKRVNDIALEQK